MYFWGEVALEPDKGYKNLVEVAEAGPEFMALLFLPQKLKPNFDALYLLVDNMSCKHDGIFDFTLLFH